MPYFAIQHAGLEFFPEIIYNSQSDSGELYSRDIVKDTKRRRRTGPTKDLIFVSWVIWGTSVTVEFGGRFFGLFVFHEGY